MQRAHVEQVVEGIYRQEVPFFAGTLSLYALIEGRDTLLIDTGDRRSTSPTVWSSIIGGVQDAQVFVTHNHPDHSGNVDELYRQGATILMNQRGCNRVFDKGAFQRLAGYPAMVDDALLTYYWPAPMAPITEVGEGDRIESCGRTFTVLETPGHAPDHCSLLDEERGIVFTGDHIIDGIISFVGAPGLDNHDMAQAFASLDRIARLQPEMLLPSHLDPVKGTAECQRVISHIGSRYEGIVETVRKILEKQGSITAWGIEEQYAGIYKGNEKARGPRVMRSLACLEYLYDNGVAVRRINESGAAEYALA